MTHSLALILTGVLMLALFVLTTNEEFRAWLWESSVKCIRSVARFFLFRWLRKKKEKK